MLRQAFRTADLAPSAKTAAWEASLRRFAIDTSIRDDGAAGVDGCVRSYVSPRGLGFSIIESEPQAFSHEPGRHDDVFWLSLVLEGDATIALDGAVTALAPGDVIYGKRGAPGVLAFATRFRMLMANIPGATIAGGSVLPLPDRVIRLDGATGINLVLAGMLAAVAESVEQLDDARTHAIESALVHLLVNSLFDGTGEAALGGAATGRAALLRRIWQSIEARLRDPDLGIARIAEEHRLSPRYIQLLFEENGQSFRGHVRRRRLENARRDLVDPRKINSTITEICLHWGFADSATFSRAFRAEYGEAPRVYRQLALGEAMAAGARRRLLGISYRPG